MEYVLSIFSWLYFRQENIIATGKINPHHDPALAPGLQESVNNIVVTML